MFDSSGEPTGYLLNNKQGCIVLHMKRPQRRAPEESKSRILDAAEAVFAREGFDRTSLAEIGAAASVSRGLPAYFFGTKEQLYAAVVERGRQQIHNVVTRSTREGPADLDAFVERSVGAFIDYLAAHPNMVRMLQWEFLHAPGTPRQEAPIALFFEMVGVLQYALEKARVTGVDAVHLLLSIVGMCFFPFIVADPKSIDAAFLQTRKHHIMSLLRAGALPTRGGSHA
jgi:AcrR family transcriptional regulator